jgi:hypothetical protein
VESLTDYERDIYNMRRDDWNEPLVMDYLRTLITFTPDRNSEPAGRVVDGNTDEGVTIATIVGTQSQGTGALDGGNAGDGNAQGQAAKQGSKQGRRRSVFSMHKLRRLLPGSGSSLAP